jgi:hypothetical protein
VIAADVVHPVTVQCAVETGATPGSLVIEFQPETNGAVVTVQAGSYYILTP